MKVRLRDLKIEDAEISWKWRNDPDVWRQTGRNWNNYVSKETEENWIKEIRKEKNSKRFAICVGEEETYVGNVQLKDITREDAVFHIFIGEKSYWGKGVGTAATELILDYAEHKLKLKSIKLKVQKSNTAAVKIYENAGFKVNGLDDETFQNMIYIF